MTTLGSAKNLYSLAARRFDYEFARDSRVCADIFDDVMSPLRVACIKTYGKEGSSLPDNTRLNDDVSEVYKNSLSRFRKLLTSAENALPIK